MALIYQSGAFSTSGQIVPNLAVQIVQDSQVSLNGVTYSRIGIVGTATWGAKNSATTAGGLDDYLAAFGPKVASSTDAGTALSICVLQGASDFRIVRVSDGTDTAATGTIGTVTATAIYTGTAGNSIKLTLALYGASTTTYQLTVSHSVLGTRTYVGTTWTAIAAAVTADTSALIVLTVPTTVPTLAAATVTLSGGADGGTPTTEQFIGEDSDPRTGMYALRNQSCAIGMLAGLDDVTSYTTQAAFGIGEGVYMIATGPSGDTITNAVATSASGGYASYGLKVMFGDWLWWDDSTNGLMLVPAQAYVAGLLSQQSPEESGLNKQIYGVAGSQKAGLVSSGATQTYSTAELSSLFTAGFDVVTNPIPRGAIWGCRGGYNSSQNDLIYGDEYTRLTNYIAETLATGMGPYVGEPINSTLFGNVRASILGLLSTMRSAGMLDNTGTTVPYTVICDTSNNPTAQTALGYLVCAVSVQYMGINRFFIINLEGGAGVSVTVSSS
ncbi:phage tail protein [Acetobacter sacchari]|uniref:Phage tail protein n=1 Tax=Acetobacter sacchari TaxID=2661687 RepID=A0ABS3M0R9_9PROT|nr:phage tail protein [Acetobacter sacchari]MBO1361777.1 phage tail protein [Acetobacter sacchari]